MGESDVTVDEFKEVHNSGQMVRLRSAKKKKKRQAIHTPINPSVTYFSEWITLAPLITLKRRFMLGVGFQH